MTWKLQGPSRIITHDENLDVHRKGKPVYVDGKPVWPDPIDFKIVCNVQPFTGLELILVPEGDRFKEKYWVYMNQTEKPLLVEDEISRNGVKFVVQHSENWGSYTRARMDRIDVGPDASPAPFQPT